MQAVHTKLLHVLKHCERVLTSGDGGNAQREAYILITDLLAVFARQLRKTPPLAGLVYVPESSLQQALQVSGNQY